MKKIYVISPDYLPAICEEASKYDTDVVAFGSTELAVEGLTRVLISDVIGFAYLGIRLPNDLAQFREFLLLLESYKMPFKFKFVLDKKESRLRKLKLKEFHYLSFYASTFDEVVTDQTINKEVFGSLLLTAFRPYRIGINDTVQKDFSLLDDTQTKELLAGDSWLITMDVTDLATLKETLTNDIGLQRLKARGSNLSVFRVLWICSKRKLSNEDKQFLQQTRKSFVDPQEALASISDVSVFCLCKSILEVTRLDYF